jgi:hypothetical protein
VDSTTLTSGLFILAAFFVRAAVAASAWVITAQPLAIIAALMIAAVACRTIVVRIATGSLMRAVLLSLVHTSLLSQILFVCHIFIPPLCLIS